MAWPPNEWFRSARTKAQNGTKLCLWRTTRLKLQVQDGTPKSFRGSARSAIGEFPVVQKLAVQSHAARHRDGYEPSLDVGGAIVEPANIVRAAASGCAVDASSVSLPLVSGFAFVSSSPARLSFATASALLDLLCLVPPFRVSLDQGLEILEPRPTTINLCASFLSLAWVRTFSHLPPQSRHLHFSVVAGPEQETSPMR